MKSNGIIRDFLCVKATKMNHRIKIIEETMHVATVAAANAVAAQLTATAACERGCYVAPVCK